MKNLFFILILFAASQSFSQTPESLKNQRLRIGFNFSPDYSSTILKSDNPYLQNLIEDLVEPKFGYTTGIAFSYIISQWLAFDAGLHFASKGYKSSWIQLTDQNGDFVGESRYVDKFYYVDIPLTALFYLSKNKFRLYATAGFSPSIFINNKYFLEVKHPNGEEETVNSDNPMTFRTVNLVMLAGLGMDYAMSDKISLRLEPIYRRSLTAINDSSMEYYCGRWA